MSLTETDIFQIFFWLTGGVFWTVSTVSVLHTLSKYRRGLRQRTAETLITLEERFAPHRDVARQLDPASGKYAADLESAVQKSLDGVPPDQRTAAEREAIPALDHFLRFLILLTNLEKYELLERTAIVDMYCYWFNAVKNNDHLRGYVRKYFGTLDRYLDSRSFEHPGLVTSERAARQLPSA
jgi:hypothetical protein